MAVPLIAVPPGTKHVVGLLLTNPVVGDPGFGPGSIGEASSASFSSGLPVYPTIMEGPTTLGNVTRFIASVNTSETQEIAFAGDANGVGLQFMASVNYAYDPSFTSFGNRQVRRGTGGNLLANNPLYAEGAATSDTGDRAGQDVRAFLYAVDSGTPTQAVRLLASAAGALEVASTPLAPVTIPTAADFQTIAATVSVLIALNAARRFAIIQNLDSTNSVRVGDSSIGAAQGILLLAGESVTLETQAEISIFPVAGTPLVSRTEIVT